MFDFSQVTVEPLEWPIAYGPGQPEGTVLSDGLALCFVYPARGRGRWVVLRFQEPESVCYGKPNVSELDLHSLVGKAPSGQLCIVHGSPWKAEAERTNAAHRQYDPRYWERIKHYFAFLWDYTFQCLASGFVAEEMDGPYAQVLANAVDSIHVSGEAKRDNESDDASQAAAADV